MSDVNDLLRGAMNERELDLFDAFIAGFDVSGEGFNGEYVADRYRSAVPGGRVAFNQRMIEAFRAWRDA